MLKILESTTDATHVSTTSEKTSILDCIISSVLVVYSS